MMRFRLAVLAASLVLFVGSAAVPAFVRAAVTEVSFVRCANRVYAEQISCGGVIEQRGKRQVFLSTPMIVDRVLVKPGDHVEEGDLLAVVDTQLTQSVLSRSVIVDQENSQETQASLSEENLEKIRAAAALYGVSMEEIMPLIGSDQTRRIQEVRDGKTERAAIPEQILAPMDGVVTEVALESGVLSQAAGSVFTIADDGCFDLRAGVSENLVGSIRPGDAALIETAANGQKTYQGVVESVSPTAQRITAAGSPATVDVMIRILDPDEKLKDNYSASVEITSQESRSVLSLPYEAVRQDEDDGVQQEFVWVYEKGTARRKAVATGEEMTNCVEILSGLSEGDAVLIDRNGVLTEGKRVRLTAEGIQ